MSTTPEVPAVKLKGSEINDIYEQLQAFEKEDIRVIPEALFYNNFLPFFCGEPVPPQINITTWIGIAGNPFRPVDIISAEGEIVCRIPPVFEMEGVGISDRKGFSLQGMLQHMAKLNESFPIRAQKYFDEHMALMNISNDPRPHVERYVEMWNKVFERYGKPLFVSKQAAQEQQVQAQADRAELDFGDDLL